jgi:photosystem II stability/assembly factor-like uncharacterized protein
MMNRIFLSNTGRGVARAEQNADGSWTVGHLLADRDVRCLAADPHNQNVAYAGTQGEGVLRSDDWGKTWQSAGLAGHIVKTVAASPVEPGVVYAGTKPPLVYVTRDGGANWVELESFREIPGRRLWLSPTEPPGTAYVQGIAPSPTDPNTILVGIELGAVVRTDDGGQTWSRHRKGALRDCHSLIFHATDGQLAFEGGGTGAGASFSRDAGNTWVQPRKGLDRHYGWAVAADPTRPELWYASVSPGPSKAHSNRDAQAYIFRAEGDGPWQKLGGGLPQPLNYMPYALLTDPEIPGEVVAGLSNGDVWQSTDHGDTWEELGFTLGGIHRSMIMLQTS